MVLYELGWFAVALLAVGIYEWIQRGRHADSDSPNLRGWQARVRLEWVSRLLANSGQEILAVQTLRNSVMAASFMASLAGLAIPGVFSISGEVYRVASDWHREVGLPFAGGLQAVKLMFLVAVFFFAFVMFVQAIRLFNHVGYMMALPMGSHTGLSPQEVARYLNRAGASFAFGIRLFFVCLPAAAWLVDVHLMAIGTVVLLLLYRQYDRRP